MIGGYRAYQPHTIPLVLRRYHTSREGAAYTAALWRQVDLGVGLGLDGPRAGRVRGHIQVDGSAARQSYAATSVEGKVVAVGGRCGAGGRPAQRVHRTEGDAG